MDLFNNPTIIKAKESLSKEEREKYEKQGEYMFNNIDFENGGLEGQLNDFIKYIEVGLKSGLSIDDLTEDEIEALIKIKGDNWYKDYDFSSEELKEYREKIKDKN